VVPTLPTEICVAGCVVYIYFEVIYMLK